MNEITIICCKGSEIFVASPIQDFASKYAVKYLDRYQKFKPCIFDVGDILVDANLLRNGDFSSKIEEWVFVDGKDDARLAKNISEIWTVENGNTAYIEIPFVANKAKLRYHDPKFDSQIPLIPNKSYVFFGYFSAHRCTGKVTVTVTNNNGDVIFEKKETLSVKYIGGKSLKEYQAIAIPFTAPNFSANVKIEIVFGHHAEKDAENSSYIFFTHCGLIQTSKRDIPAWSPFTVQTEKLMRTLSEGEGMIYSAPIDIDIAEKACGIDIIDLNDTNGESKAHFRIDPLTGSEVKILHFDGNSFGIEISSYDGGLLVFIDGKIAYTLPSSGSPGVGRSYRVIVAEDFCDAEIHLIEVRDETGLHALARDAQIFPATLTPWHARQSHSKPPFPFHRSAPAAFRYRSLNSLLEKLRSGIATCEFDKKLVMHLAQLPYLHQILEGGFERIKKFVPLDFPIEIDPKVSVIIPVHNKFNVTYFCLCALLFAANRVNFEVVVVDDGSEDDTLDLSSIAPNVTYCRNEVAQGFVRACNLGASHARGEYLVFLNNDTEPTVGWLDELLLTFDNFDGVGMAGAKLLYPDGRLQEAGGIVWNNGNPWNYGRLANPWDPRFCYARQADYLSGAAVMLPRSVWDDVGGFSDEFAPAYFEDTDLCFKVRDAGYKTFFVPTSIVYHFEGISNGTDVNTSTGLKRYQEINRPKFKRKWASAVQNNGDEGTYPDLAKDRGILGRVLFIDSQTPKPDIDAGSYATIKEMRLVQSLGYKVTFAASNMAFMGHYDEDLNRLGIETVHAPFYLSIDELLEKRGNEFDIVYITRYYVANHVIPSIRNHAPNVKILFNNCDLHFLRELRIALRNKSPEAMQHAIKVRDEELSIMRQVDVVLSYNEVEHAVITSHNLDSTKVVKCPWVVETCDPSRIPGFETRVGFAFLGGYGHPPNVEAVEFFVREVMPLLRKRLPCVVFNVYGSSVPTSIKNLASDDVNIIGYVETVDEVYNQNRLFIAPLLTGAGIKGKVLGALSYGIPTVLSPVAAESTGVRDGLECAIAQTPEEWVDAICKLYHDQDAWEAMSRNALEFTQRFYSFENGKKLMKDAFEAVGVYRVLQ